jgi:hypothetical protein
MKNGGNGEIVESPVLCMHMMGYRVIDKRCFRDVETAGDMLLAL